MVAGYTSLPPKDSLHQHLKEAKYGHHALKPNTYDAVTWAGIKMNDPSLQQAKGKAHLAVAFSIPFCLLIVTILLQVGAIFGLLQFTVARAEDKYTMGGEDQRTSTILILDAIANNTELDPQIHAHLLEMCETDHNVPYSQSVMTWLWGIKLLPVLSQAIWVMVLAIRLPRPVEGENWIAKDEKDKHLGIVRMGFCAKVFVVCCVDLPRILVTLYLYWMGANFLMYAKSLGVLIMKSIGLGFIALLPDVIFAGSFSEAFQKELTTVKLDFIEDDGENADGKEVVCNGMDNWNLWGASVVKVLGVLLVSLFYCRVLCGDLQSLREACIDYKYAFILPKCPKCGSHFFGLTLYN